MYLLGAVLILVSLVVSARFSPRQREAEAMFPKLDYQTSDSSLID
jgi:hypothetical protein